MNIEKSVTIRSERMLCCVCLSQYIVISSTHKILSVKMIAVIYDHFFYQVKHLRLNVSDEL